MFHYTRTCFAVIGLLLLSVSSVLADGHGATTETERVHKTTFTSIEEAPCLSLFCHIGT